MIKLSANEVKRNFRENKNSYACIRKNSYPEEINRLENVYGAENRYVVLLKKSVDDTYNCCYCQAHIELGKEYRELTVKYPLLKLCLKCFLGFETELSNKRKIYEIEKANFEKRRRPKFVVFPDDVIKTLENDPNFTYIKGNTSSIYSFDMFKDVNTKPQCKGCKEFVSIDEPHWRHASGFALCDECHLHYLKLQIE